ncbi:hypothetical protein HOLDEFILI_03744 [Holdemania filiformis DSM 12042]|uniref:Uncharacterized protein n=1 Tax=Holdemania filiformis DSM 12042 TaxID=545696 RepID=B9YD31_9FIRM|nr:hypothetical protein HOLDEFILI_03744 [Holdemania filiformis DSM 12042]
MGKDVSAASERWGQLICFPERKIRWICFRKQAKEKCTYQMR